MVLIYFLEKTALDRMKRRKFWVQVLVCEKKRLYIPVTNCDRCH